MNVFISIINFDKKKFFRTMRRRFLLKFRSFLSIFVKRILRNWSRRRKRNSSRRRRKKYTRSISLKKRSNSIRIGFKEAVCVFPERSEKEKEKSIKVYVSHFYEHVYSTRKHFTSPMIRSRTTRKEKRG